MGSKQPIWIPTWLGLVIAVGVLWLVVKVMTGGEGLSTVHVEDRDASDRASREVQWTLRGQEAVRRMLKDPDSAEFRNVRFHQGKDGVPMTCGEVNSKNSFGGYGGFQRFISAGRDELTYLSEQMDASDFAEVWNRFCAG